MRGVIMHGPGDVRVEERERPQIVEPTDAILRVTASSICGSTCGLIGASGRSTTRLRRVMSTSGSSRRSAMP